MNRYIVLFLFLASITGSLSFASIPNSNMKLLKRSQRSPANKKSIVYCNVEKTEDNTIETLKYHAKKIIDIIEFQKDTFNLPLVSRNSMELSNNLATIKEAKNISEKEEIKDILNIILDNFKKNGKDMAEEALKTLQFYCSYTNGIKSKESFELKKLFADGKYGIFLGKFDNYYITNYNKVYYTDDDKVYYEVDVKMEATYQTLIYNSIQFDEMYFPEESGDPYYVIYRWIFVKLNDKFSIDGCYLLHKPLSMR